MPDASAHGDALIELISPENTRRSIPLAQSPFLIGRGEAGNQLAIPDRRISRNCAAVISSGGQFSVVARGNQLGVFVNGDRISAHAHALRDGDVLTFGIEDSYRIVFHSTSSETTIEHL